MNVPKSAPIPASASTDPRRLLAYACLALSMALVGCYVALSKPLLATFPVFLLAWLRFGIAAACMPHWLRKPADEPEMTRRTRGLVFLESFLGNFLFSICMLYGVSLTSAVSAGVIMAAIPAAVAAASWLFLREPVSLRLAGAIACSALGIGLLALAPASHAPGSVEAVRNPMPWLGNLLVFAAVLCEASYAVIGKSLSSRLGPKRICALINLWGLALTTPMGLWLAWRFDFAGVPLGSWLLLGAYAFAASIGTVWLWMTGLRRVAAAKAGVFAVLLPVSAAAIGVLVLGETLSAVQASAFAIALVGVLLATLPEKHPQCEAQAPEKNNISQ